MVRNIGPKKRMNKQIEVVPLFLNMVYLFIIGMHVVSYAFDAYQYFELRTHPGPSHCINYRTCDIICGLINELWWSFRLLI